MGMFKGIFFFFDFFLDPLSMMGSFRQLLMFCAICCFMGLLGFMHCGRHRASDEETR